MIVGCLKCILGMNLSCANKSLFTISFDLYLEKIAPNNGALFKGEISPNNNNSNNNNNNNNDNNPLASCSLRNLGFLLPHTVHFDKSIGVPVFVFTTLGFLLYVFFLYFKQ